MVYISFSDEKVVAKPWLLNKRLCWNWADMYNVMFTREYSFFCKFLFYLEWISEPSLKWLNTKSFIIGFFFYPNFITYNRAVWKEPMTVFSVNVLCTFIGQKLEAFTLENLVYVHLKHFVFKFRMVWGYIRTSFRVFTAMWSSVRASITVTVTRVSPDSNWAPRH